ncbi:cysteine desulfurase [Leptospira kirschneri]|uniref:Cysteine desulfurase n=2 Tax=Leptospira kirschneri TaxID=29507 RepID=A0A0E2AWX5_9LEPT|nr:cysteine desulfurase [Leptospira kirschneri]EKO13399.1 cysteine desulfurase, SufS family [Leptospira kirschneri str. H1]EKO63063.1 cysteine desulfurase, SufS family [Leptospira kirschneri str. H2]EMK21309.1 cysteine desulfurase, SufS family [Leptospira kirschneri serovar Bulgarica str. Nikolaevo]UML81562.1 cysteine desulfurase [Leptospira kirschneri]
MSFSAERIRTDFPILGTKMNGKPLVFLDSAASSQKPFTVIDTIEKYYREENANIHRGIYYLSQKATEKYELSRIRLSRFIGAQCAKVCIFTRNATESINLVAQTWGRTQIKEGDEIVLNELEHHSNIVPWQMLAQEKKAVLKFIPLNEDSTLDLSNLIEIITTKTKLVAISQMSNVTGTIHDILPIQKRAKEVGAKLLVDGAQGVCHLPVNMKEMEYDFYVFSAHKMLGPTGVGVLYAKEEILEEMPPWMGGGDMIARVYKERSTYAELPSKLEAGTPNIAGVIGFGSAIEYLENIGMQEIRNHEVELLSYALNRLDDFGGLELYGTRDLSKRGGVISFNFPGVHPHDVGTILDEEGIAIRVGHHCAQLFMAFQNIPGTCRASLYLYNTKDDIDRLIQGLIKVKEIFSRVLKR